MTDAKDVAIYFLNKDTSNELFTSERMKRGAASFAVGNARLNKYLHIAQNMWIAKTGQLLFFQPLLAFDNGAVVDEIRMNFSAIAKSAQRETSQLSDDVKCFLDKLCVMLREATIDDLIELSHQDSEWRAKSKYEAKKDQVMDSLAKKDEYKTQYSDALVILDGLAA
jgi:uncharacterized phage-associated protein